MEEKWSQLENQLLREIAQGRYRAGEKLPSRNRLAARFGCSRATVEHAIASLTRAGYLTARRGSGTTVLTPKPDRKLKRVWLIASGNVLEDWRCSSGMMFSAESFGCPVGTIEFERLTEKWEALSAPGSAAIWFMPGPERLERLETLRRRGIPQLLINRSYRDFDCVATEPESSLREGLAWLLIEAGRELALISGRPSVDFPYIAERQLAFFRLAAELGAKLRPEWIHAVAAGDPLGELGAIASGVFGSTHRPRGICLLDQTLAIPLAVAARSYGLELGRDWFLLTFDQVPELGSSHGTGMLSQQYPVFLREAVRWVRSAAGTGAPFRVFIKTELIVTP